MVTVAVDEIRELTPVERIERLHAIDAELRRLEAEAAVLVAQVGDDGGFRDRGHLTI
jgi:ribosomal protein L29